MMLMALLLRRATFDAERAIIIDAADADAECRERFATLYYAMS